MKTIYLIIITILISVNAISQSIEPADYLIPNKKISQQYSSRQEKNDTVENDKTLYLKPFHVRFSLLTPAITIEKTLLSPAHTVYAGYSGYPMIDLFADANEGESLLLWTNHLIGGYKWYFDLNKRIDKNKRYFNHNAFFADLYHRWTPETNRIPHYTGVGINLGRQLTYKYLYGSICLGLESKYEFVDDNITFSKPMFFPKIRVGVFLPYSKIPNKTLEEHAPYFGQEKSGKDAKLKSFYFRLNIIKPGVEIEHSIFNEWQTLELSIYGWLGLPMVLMDVADDFPFISHNISLSYKNYYNLNKRIQLGKNVKNYHANYLGFKTEYISSWIFEPKNDNFYGLGLIWGGQVSFNNWFYIGYEAGPSIFFNKSKIVKPWDIPVTFRTETYLGFYF
jgi:hypothetical protein